MGMVVSVVDADVHLLLESRISAVLEYLPAAWREKFNYLGHLPLSSSPLDFNYLMGSYYVVGRDTLAQMEFPSGPDIESLTQAVFDGSNVTAAQLIAPEVATHCYPARNAGIGTHLTSAFNDYLLDQWIVDERLRYALVVFPDDAEAAVSEIRRHGSDRRVSSIWLPSSGARLGDRRFFPLYAAAMELGLPIISHPSASRLMTSAEMGFEGRANVPIAAWADITSLISRGVFERFPELKFVFLECGYSWIEPLVNRMDSAWTANRGKLEDLKQSPSEIVRKHISFSTNPLDDDRDHEKACRLVEETPWLSEVLLYSSNYPRGYGSSDMFSGLPVAMTERILAGNSEAALRL
jgi:uncharacterized protein